MKELKVDCNKYDLYKIFSNFDIQNEGKIYKKDFINILNNSINFSYLDSKKLILKWL